ncbi:hypothetical protein SBF1_8010002 [Candidatus Desulfosporosinus infrequens]|uniref:HTH rpiR-type domain-containing protein n=1 Tax=Candidatus Desulfosporosinus infrequens TaxID=2043169 RepID=A0A2U3LTI4_9FIRM|nr:hypothetical protein SBF1_8010002 [Candidatus Desulfosporosinus infrequens]
MNRERVENALSSCLPRIRSGFNELTKTEQKTATYILENPTEVIHMTITELAEAAQNAEATVFRLCKKLGFSGYQEMKIALAGDLYTPLESVYKEVDPADSIRTMASKIFLGINEGLPTKKPLKKPSKPSRKRGVLMCMDQVGQQSLLQILSIVLCGLAFLYGPTQILICK